MPFIHESNRTRQTHPLLHLPREDLDLIAEMVLQSGSLKGLAKAYGVSYPTIRGRLDRVIDRLKDVLEGRAPDPLRETLASLVERGELSAGGAHQIRTVVHAERSKRGGF